MDSASLLHHLKRIIDPTKCSIAGVFPRDMLSLEWFKKFPACCIVNTDDSSKQGTHWVAYYTRSPQDYEFFDSYGLSPAHYGFEWLSPTTFNTVKLQTDFSNTCGHFCLYYLMLKHLAFQYQQ